MSDRRHHQAPLWKIWANPIFQRYTRSRLRPGPLTTWIVVTLIATGFSFLLPYLYDLTNGHSRAEAANDGFLPVFIIQAIILMLMGTGSVASGAALEADDGMTSYMRLTPMTPLAKIVGYLFGLPAREYILFACTLPFTVFSISAGTLGMDRALEIYLVLFLATILYHLTGCVAGTVVANRRFAGRVAQIMVVLLYFALPKLSLVGFVFFEYLTLRPVVIENLNEIKSALPLFDQLFTAASKIPNIRFFEIEFDRLEFSLLIQSSLVFTFALVLYRKWRQESHHLLGKNFCVFLFLWILLLLIGNALPLMAESKNFFPRLWLLQKGMVDPKSAYLVAALFGLGVLLLAFALTSIFTPSMDEYIRGLRRARKLGQKRIPWRSDGASATRYVFIIAVIGSGFWSIFIHHAFNSEWVKEVPHGERLLRWVPAGIALYIFCYHGMLERFGRRALLMFALFVWIVPVLVGIIILATGNRDLPILMGAMSAFAAPFYIIALPVNGGNEFGQTTKLMQAGIAFSLFAHLVFALFLAWSLNRHKARIKAQVAAEK